MRDVLIAPRGRRFLKRGITSCLRLCCSGLSCRLLLLRVREACGQIACDGTGLRDSLICSMCQGRHILRCFPLDFIKFRRKSLQPRFHLALLLTDRRRTFLHGSKSFLRFVFRHHLILREKRIGVLNGRWWQCRWQRGRWSSYVNLVEQLQIIIGQRWRWCLCWPLGLRDVELQKVMVGQHPSLLWSSGSRRRRHFHLLL